MSTLQGAIRAVQARVPELLTLTEQLVRVNSYSGNVPGVNAVGDLLVDATRDLPLQLERVSGDDTGDHLGFRTAAEGRPVLLIGHHDTVFPPGTFEGFRIDGDLARGPGVLDMKGSLAMIIVTLRALHEAFALESLPLCFVSVGDEEIGSPSSRPFLERLAREAECALVFEAGRAGDAIITERRGAGRARVEVHGRAAHAGNALVEGRNAIWALAKLVDAAQGLTDAARGTSLNVGLVRGGTSRNTVPDHAVAELDLRFNDDAGRDALCDGLRAAARHAESAVEGTRVDVEIVISRPPLVRSEASSRLFERYAACQLAAGLGASECPLVGGGSDANTVSAVGLATIDGLGPRGTGFHTLEERVEISSFALKAEALLRFLLGAGA